MGQNRAHQRNVAISRRNGSFRIRGKSPGGSLSTSGCGSSGSVRCTKLQDRLRAYQQDIGKGYVVDVAYVGNVAHHQFNQGAIDLNAVPPLTTWTPTANNGQPGPVARFLDPTSANGNSAFYSTNLIRAHDLEYQFQDGPEHQLDIRVDSVHCVGSTNRNGLSDWRRADPGTPRNSFAAIHVLRWRT